MPRPAWERRDSEFLEKFSLAATLQQCTNPSAPSGWIGDDHPPIFETYSAHDQSPGWAGQFLDDWCAWVMQTNLEPKKKVGKTLQAHWHLIFSGFTASGRLSSGTVEGFNDKAKLSMRTAYGFRSPKTP
ncbi:MAG: transposase [Planctomycetes bacterium]|nr:transposase [Planctomycetota bacterium]